jgi:hypothetical protein
MSTSPIHLPQPVLALAQQLAAAKHLSVEEVVAVAITQLSESQKKLARREIVGAFSDCADLLDEIVEDAFRQRESWPYRQPPE